MPPDEFGLRYGPFHRALRRVAAEGDLPAPLRSSQRITPDIDVLMRLASGGDEVALGPSGTPPDGMFRVRRSVGPVVP